MQNPLADQTCQLEWSLYSLSHNLENVAELLRGCMHNQPKNSNQLSMQKVSKIETNIQLTRQKNTKMIKQRSGFNWHQARLSTP